MPSKIADIVDPREMTVVMVTGAKTRVRVLAGSPTEEHCASQNAVLDLVASNICTVSSSRSGWQAGPLCGLSWLHLPASCACENLDRQFCYVLVLVPLGWISLIAQFRVHGQYATVFRLFSRIEKWTRLNF